jgi:DNA segregation ATPase FtsK/SpoIIIE-like protein
MQNDSEEIPQLVRDFKRSCSERGIQIDECQTERAVVGPGVIRFPFKLSRGQKRQAVSNHLEDIGREMRRSGILIQAIPNSDELYLDVPRLRRETVLFADIVNNLPVVSSPEQLPFAVGRTPDGKDFIKDLAECYHLLVGGSTGSGKTVFLWTLLTSLVRTHPSKDSLQILLSSSGLEDFTHFENLPHLFGGKIYSDATETTEQIKDVIFREFERRKELLIKARVENIQRYNENHKEKLAPLVVIIDEFADLTDQLGAKKEKEAFFTPIRQIAQIGRKRGIHLVLCTQRPAADLVPSNIKAQLNAQLALRVNDYQSSKMILDETGAQHLQKQGDMIFKDATGYER